LNGSDLKGKAIMVNEARAKTDKRRRGGSGSGGGRGERRGGGGGNWQSRY